MIIESGLSDGNFELKSIDAFVHSKKIVKWLSDPELNKYLLVRHKSISESEQIEHINSLNFSADSFYLGIFRLGNSELIGTTTCRVDHSETFEVGILIGERKLHGRGLGATTLALLEVLAKRMNMKKLSAGIELENVASLALFKKMDFQIENDQFINDKGAKCIKVGKFLKYDSY
jgi:RimJ/RimL family protein N-acetyltransferase